MKAKLLTTLILAAVAGTVQAQINVGANTITGTDSSVYAGTLNTNNANNAAIGGYKNTIIANGASSIIGGGSYNWAGGTTTTIGGGYDNFSTNSFTTISGGLGNTVLANAATIPGGAYAVANHFGQLAYSSQKLSVEGDSQSSLFVLRNSTSNTNTAELSLSTGAFMFRMTLGSGAVWSFRALVTAKSASTGNAGAWEIKGIIKNIGGTTTTVGVTKTALGQDVAGWDANAVADDTNDALVINVNGDASSTVSWTAAVTTSELN
jgi:hypothetical protein